MQNTDIFGEVTVERLGWFARLFQIEWLVALVLGIIVVASIRGSIRRHRALLLGLAVVSFSIRLALVDFHETGAQLPYVVQATCIVFPEARESYNICAYRLFGDNKRLGVASLLALGFQVFGGFKAVAAGIVLGLSVLNTLLLFAVTIRAFRCRWTALAAGLLYAIHPTAIHLAAATETETPTDTFLLLGALLLLWDHQRGPGPVQGLARQLAASATVRALFLALAFNTRFELLLFLPLFVVSSVRRGGWTATRHVATLLFVTTLLLLPENPGPAGQIPGLNPLPVQIERWWSHVTDFHVMLLGSPAATLLLVGGLGLALAGRSGARASGRLLAALALLVSLMMTVSAGLLAYSKPHENYFVYRGSVLWWPFAALAGAAIVRRVTAALAQRWRLAATAATVAVLSLVFAASFARTQDQFSALGLRWLNPEFGRYRALAAAVAPRSLVVVSTECYGSGEIAAALLSQGPYRLLEVGMPPCEPVGCDEIRGAVAAAETRGQASIIVGPSLEPQCGLEMGIARSVAGFTLQPVHLRRDTPSVPDANRAVTPAARP